MHYTDYTPLLYFHEVAGKTLNWYCGDDLENYNKHNKKGWHYHNSAENLEYKFNSLGYRTKELSDTKDDYILVFGCSYTEGVGLYQEEIWCNKIAKMYDIEVINLAKAGTGPDIVALNTQLFVKNKFKLPKCVVIQWPHSSRKSFAYIENSTKSANSLGGERRCGTPSSSAPVFPRQYQHGNGSGRRQWEQTTVAHQACKGDPRAPVAGRPPSLRARRAPA